MPKVTRPLTNTEIKNARGKAKEYNLADGLGLALRVRPGGDKYWIFNYQRPISTPNIIEKTIWLRDKQQLRTR